MKNPKEEKCTCKEHDSYCCQIHGNCPTCVKKEELKQENCCTPLGHIKRYVDCYGCDRKPKQEKLTYTESAKKEERISNCTMMKRKQETLEEREPYWDLVDVKAEQNNTIDLDAYAKGVQEGAKWQMDKQSDFIIGFLEFIEGTYSYSNIFDHWYLHANTSKTYSKKQLLEVYLKRNKL